MKGYRTPPKLLAAWQSAALSLARPPRGSSRDDPPALRLQRLLKSERAAIGELWETFTQERRDLRRSLLAQKRDAVAYLLGFHLPNAARMQLALDRMAERTALAALFDAVPGLWRWHDVGCGTAALTHAAIEHLRQRRFPFDRLQLHLTDASGALLDAARAVLAATETGLEPRTHRLRIEELPVERYAHDAGVQGSVYALGYVWNELGRNKPARSRLQRIWDGHAARGEPALVLMLEPATQDLCREAMTWRDGMVESGWTPLYPCPAPVPCPMLARTRDWCYSEGLWERPRPVALLDKELGLDRSQIAVTIFAMASPALAAKARAQTNPPVVVGRPVRVGKVGFDYLVCRGDRLDKAAPKRGAAMLLRGTPAGQELPP